MLNLKFREISGQNELVGKCEVLGVLEDLQIFKKKNYFKCVVDSKKEEKKVI